MLRLVRLVALYKKLNILESLEINKNLKNQSYPLPVIGQWLCKSQLIIQNKNFSSKNILVFFTFFQ